MRACRSDAVLSLEELYEGAERTGAEVVLAQDDAFPESVGGMEAILRHQCIFIPAISCLRMRDPPEIRQRIAKKKHEAAGYSSSASRQYWQL